MEDSPPEYDFRRHPEWIAESAWLAPGVQVCGEVHLGNSSSVWFNAVVRGDTERISVGNATNIQDLCLVHADAGVPCTIGDRVTLGHAAIVHGATIEDDVMIGIRATVLNGATIGTGSLIAAGALVPENSVIPPHSVVMGIPGKIVRQTTDSDQRRIRHAAEHYVQAAIAYREQSGLEEGP
ncbi:MAG: gamma carbonic anhydrase family protein [Planctomycetota bacterium]|nr:gamma carbonic anhydrase family protein [Planctomycetota bacterium]